LEVLPALQGFLTSMSGLRTSSTLNFLTTPQNFLVPPQIFSLHLRTVSPALQNLLQHLVSKFYTTRTSKLLCTTASLYPQLWIPHTFARPQASVCTSELPPAPTTRNTLSVPKSFKAHLQAYRFPPYLWIPTNTSNRLHPQNLHTHLQSSFRAYGFPYTHLQASARSPHTPFSIYTQTHTSTTFPNRGTHSVCWFCAI